MNLMLIGKYPPIQGGVSSQIFWLMKSLGERGHNISVISNCMEVEEEYRMQLNDIDVEKLQPKGVKLHSTVPVRTYSFIPRTNPYSEKLISLALDVSDDQSPDLIFGWYLLPYGVAAHSAANLLGKKYALNHAGSDITTLFNDPYLQRFLRRIILDADAIFTRLGIEEKFKELGAKQTFVQDVNPVPGVFNPYDEKLDVLKEFGLDIDNEKTLLFLGKVNKTKGIEYLLDAFGDLDEDTNLIVCGNGMYRTKCENRVLKLGLKNRVHFVGTLPHWRIPSLIRSVKAVVVPEYNFGVSIHRSGIPYESILCGKVALVSSEIIGSYGDLSKYFLEIDPPNRIQFSERLEMVLHDDETNKNLTKNHNKIRSLVGDYESYVQRMEKSIMEVAQSV